jgi:hypothetical protein
MMMMVDEKKKRKKNPPQMVTPHTNHVTTKLHPHTLALAYSLKHVHFGEIYFLGKLDFKHYSLRV